MDIPVWILALLTLFFMYIIYSVRKFNLQMRIREGLQVRYVETFDDDPEGEEEPEPEGEEEPEPAAEKEETKTQPAEAVEQVEETIAS